MKKLTTSKRTAVVLGLLALGAFAAVAAPIEMGPAPFGGDRADKETTISIKTSSDAEPTVIHVPDLEVGETRTLRSDSGRDVQVTRTDDGFTVKVGERDFLVQMRPHGEHMFVMKRDGHEEHVKTVVSGDGPKRVVVSKNGYGYRTGDGAGLKSASELLDKHKLTALDGADRRTRETVAQAIDELVKKGLIIAPSLEALPGGEDGERVEIRVTR
jgi:hypothetical protein